MYAQKFIVEVEIGDPVVGGTGDGREAPGGARRPCPLDWLDSFCMRNFTGAAEFDDTLPIAEGLIEAGWRVSPDRLAAAMSEWFTRRGKGDGKAVRVEVRPAS